MQNDFFNRVNSTLYSVRCKRWCYASLYIKRSGSDELLERREPLVEFWFSGSTSYL